MDNNGADEKEILAEQLAQAKREAAEAAAQLNGIKTEQVLMRKLAEAGASDLETAILVAKARMEGLNEADADGVIEKLKAEKQYLFGGERRGFAAARKTAGVKDKTQNSQTALERAARRAAKSGSRADLHEYLRLRRAL